MEFKELEIKPKGNILQRKWRERHFRRSVTAMAAGALLSFLFFYFSEGRQMDILPTGDVLKSLAIGAFFGLFITNSPCARGRC